MKKIVGAALIIIILTLVASAYADSKNPYIGRWEGKNEWGLPQAIIFREDKTCRGVLSVGFASLVVEGKYSFNSAEAVLSFKDIRIDLGALGIFSNDGSAEAKEAFGEMLNKNNEFNLEAVYGTNRAVLQNDNTIKLGNTSFSKNKDYVVKSIIKDGKLSGYWEPDIDAYIDYANNLMTLFGGSSISDNNVFAITQEEMPSLFFDNEGEVYIFINGKYNKASYIKSSDRVNIQYNDRVLTCSYNDNVLTIYIDSGIGLSFVKTHSEKPEISQTKLVGFWDKNPNREVHNGYYIASNGNVSEVYFSDSQSIMGEKTIGNIQLCGEIIAFSTDETSGYKINLTEELTQTKSEKEINALLKEFSLIENIPDVKDDSIYGIWQSKDISDIAAIFDDGNAEINNTSVLVKTKNGEIWFYHNSLNDRWYIKGKYKGTMMILPIYQGTEQSVFTKIEAADLLNYTQNSKGEIQITGLKKKISILDIPKTINGSFVTSIAKEAFKGYKGTGIKTVRLPASIREIGHSAFSQCSDLTTVYLPQADFSLGNRLFEGCTSLKAVFNLNRAIKIGSYCFASCSNLEQVIFGNSLEAIDNYAFYECTQLKDVILPDNCTQLGIGIFHGCSNLEHVQLPSDLKAIPEIEFTDCVNLIDIVFPDSLTQIGKFAFSGCSQLENIQFPDSLEEIKDGAFIHCGIETLILPKRLRKIGDSAFGECMHLQNVEINANLKELQQKAFLGCEKLKTIVFNGSYNQLSLNTSTFYRCRSLESIDLPNGTISIGETCFGECDQLISIMIPDSVKTIHESAFKNSTKVVVFAVSGTYAESYCNQNNISYQTITEEEQDRRMFGNDPALQYDVVRTSGDYEYKLMQDGDAEIVKYLGNAPTVIIPEQIKGYTVRRIGERALSYCWANEIIIPDTVKVIGNSAFYGSYCTSIKIPDSIQEIQESAFYSCRNITEIHLPSSIDTISDYAFADCDKLAIIVIPKNVKKVGRKAFTSCDGLVSIEIQEGVEAVEDGAFEFCDGIKRIILPASLHEIGEDIFEFVVLHSGAFEVPQQSYAKEWLKEHGAVKIQ